MAEIKRKTKKKSQGAFLRDSIMTGISYMIPVIVGAGVLQAIAKAMGGYDIGSHMDEIDTLAKAIMLLGQNMMNFVVPVIAAFIAYAMADKPGLAPGFVMGALAGAINTGFVGGVVGGILVGYFVLAVKKIQVPKAIQGIMPILVIPVVTTLVCGLLMYYVIGVPIRLFMETLTGALTSLNGGSKFILGAVIGAMICFDHGGPINKTAALFVNGLIFNSYFRKDVRRHDLSSGNRPGVLPGRKEEVYRCRERAGKVLIYPFLLLRTGGRYSLPDEGSHSCRRVLYDWRSCHRRSVYDYGSGIPGCSRRRLCHRHDLQSSSVCRLLAPWGNYHRCSVFHPAQAAA